MAESQGFSPLKEFGSISLTDSSEIRFYVDEYKGYPYASVRTFVKRENYAGPTKAGLTFNADLLAALIEALGKLPPEPAALEDTELGRFQKKAGLEVVARITLYRDTTGIDLREWVDDGVYQGWSKRGVRINYSELAKIQGYFKDMLAFLRTRKAPEAKKKAAPKTKAE